MTWLWDFIYSIKKGKYMKMDYEIGKYVEIGYDLGKLVQETHETYGEVWKKTDQILAVLYPDGVKPHDFAHMSLIIRLSDSMCRIAAGPSMKDDNPWEEIGGYGIMGSTIGRGV